MPQITDSLETGTYGNVILYDWRGKKCMRIKGKTGRQAPVAKKQAAILGKASAISARLRAACKPILPDPGNRKLMYRLNNILQQWLRTDPMDIKESVNAIAFLNGFSFYENSAVSADLHLSIPVSRTAEDNLLLHIPVFDSPNPISPLSFNGNIHLHIIAASCNVDDPADTRSYETVLDIAYTGIVIPAQKLLLPLQTRPGNLTVLALSVNGMAAGIVGAMYN